MFERISGSKEIDTSSTINANELNKKINGNETGIVFFTGAGFSKAWKSDYPLGFDLFSIQNITTIKDKYNFFKVADDLEISIPQKTSNSYPKDCYEFFKEIKFHLDIYKRYPSLSPNFLDPSTIIALEAEMRSFVVTRFEELVGIEELKLTNKKDGKHVFSIYFNKLTQESCNISFISTNYDLIIEKIFFSQNKKIMLNRGTLDTENFSNKKWHPNKVDLFKINGGFEVECLNSNEFCVNHSKKLTTPHIILPSKEQNYSDKYYKNVFIKSASKLRGADLLIFIGYSLPIEDQTIQFLLKNFKDSHNTNKEIVIIDYNLDVAEEIMGKVKKLFPNIASKGGIYAYEGNFEGFVSQSISS